MDAHTISRPRTVTMPRMHITIRPAGVEDHERIASLARETFVDSFAADNRPEDMAAYLEKAFSPSIQAMELAEPSSRFLIAETGGKTVGYARHGGSIDAVWYPCKKAHPTVAPVCP